MEKEFTVNNNMIALIIYIPWLYMFPSTGLLNACDAAIQLFGLVPGLFDAFIYYR